MCEQLLDDTLRPMVETLIARKQQMPESGMGEHIKLLDEYIADQLTRIKSLAQNHQEERLTDWQPLDALFLTLLAQNR